MQFLNMQLNSCFLRDDFVYAIVVKPWAAKFFAKQKSFILSKYMSKNIQYKNYERIVPKIVIPIYL